MSARELHIKPANSPDFGEVSVLFADPGITELFAELLLVRGVKATVVASPEQVMPETKVITEAKFVNAIPDTCRPTALCVGDREALQGMSGVLLCRPLTEEKIEEAFRVFLLK